MLSIAIRIIEIIFAIIAYYYLIQLYKDTEKDPFQQNFGFEEKKKIFNYHINKENQMTEKQKKCKEYQDLILAPETRKLGDVFVLNIESINYYSFLTLIIFACQYIFFIITILLVIFATMNDWIYFVLGCSFCFIFIFNYSFVFILIYKIFSADFNSYYRFLSCDNVSLYQFEKYRSIENIKFDFMGFLIFSIISGILNRQYKNIIRRNE